MTNWQHTVNIAAALNNWEETTYQTTAAAIYETLTATLTEDLAAADEVWEFHAIALDETADQQELEQAIDTLQYWADNEQVWIECYTEEVTA